MIAIALILWLWVCLRFGQTLFRHFIQLGSIFKNHFQSAKRKRKIQDQLILLVPSLSSMLKSGHSLERSIRELHLSIPPPLQYEIEYMLKEARVGASIEECLLDFAKRYPSENTLMFACAVSISKKLGASLSETMDHISINILEREKLRQQVKALSTQGKMQAWVAAIMPVGLAAALHFLSPGYFEPFFSSPLGLAVLAGCIVSLVLGLFWIYSIAHQEYL